MKIAINQRKSCTNLIVQVPKRKYFFAIFKSMKQNKPSDPDSNPNLTGTSIADFNLKKVIEFFSMKSATHIQKHNFKMPSNS